VQQDAGSAQAAAIIHRDTHKALTSRPRKLPHHDKQSAHLDRADQMGRGRFTEAQMIGKIKEQDRRKDVGALPMSGLCRTYGLRPG
jgi:hypothetical protein